MFQRFSSVVHHHIDDVFHWHERPGAIVRLTPPWLPIRVVSEARSLRDGVAVMALPGGITWHARHSGYDPPHRFVDTLRAPLPLRWRHSHEFADVDGKSTRITDNLTTNVPGFLLSRMFRYRHRQLAADLNAIERAADWSDSAPTVAVTGSSGMIGTALTAFLTTAGVDVVRLVRHPTDDAGYRHWNPDNPDADLLNGVDVVVHLAGAPIAGRFTSAHKRAIRDSRIDPTRRLARLAAATPDGPSTFVCASAIGYYGPDRGDTELTEESAPGSGFLAEVVADWEAATRPASDAGLRVVNVRTGLVQSPAGGMLRLLHPLFSAGLGGRIGNGRQWMSWIDIDDLTDIYHRAIVDDRLSGPINAVAPEAVRNTEYTMTLADTLHRPAMIPVPSLGPRVLLGSEGADEVAAANQRVLPTVLQQNAHTYRFETLQPSLAHLFGRPER